MQYRPRFEVLDGLRFVAALGVVLFHIGFRVWNQHSPGVIEYPVLGHLAQYGYLGVDLFFLISGFVILMTAERGGLRAFLTSRVVRLYPAYWVCVLLTALFLVTWNTPPTAEQFVVNLTMLQHWLGQAHIDGSYWTLVVEMKFYLLIALVVFLGWMPHIDRVLGVWLLCGIASDFMAPLHGFGEAIAAPWCHYFVAGALAYRMRSNQVTPLRACLFLLAFAQAARHAHWYMDLKQRLTGVPHDAWVVQGVVLLLLALFAAIALDCRLHGPKALQRLGSLTYPLYLIHGVIGSAVVVSLVQERNFNHWAALLAVVLTSVAAAYVIERYLERPLSRRLKAWVTPFYGTPKAAEPG